MTSSRKAIDLHVDTLLRIVEKGGDFVEERPDLQVDPVRARAGGVRLLLFACFTPEDHPEPAGNVSAMLRRAGELHDDPRCPMQKVRTPGDYDALPSDRVGFLLTIENALSLEGDLARLESWADAGVRLIGLTWNDANDIASGVLAERDGGLTSLGREAVARMSALGMAVDLSHLAPRGVDEVLEAGVPVCATHCNAAAVHQHPRNLSDTQLRGVAERGGVVGLNFYPDFLGTDEVDLDTIARHAGHMAAVMGAEHVALGTDLDGVPALPRGFDGHQSLPRLDDALARIGFDDTARDGIFHDNFVRWWRSWGSRL